MVLVCEWTYLAFVARFQSLEEFMVEVLEILRFNDQSVFYLE